MFSLFRLSILDVRHWPVAFKTAALCVSVSAALAIGLTTMGYMQVVQALCVPVVDGLGHDQRVRSRGRLGLILQTVTGLNSPVGSTMPTEPTSSELLASASNRGSSIGTPRA